MKQIPESFLMLTHEGLFRANIQLENVYNIDKLLARFSQEKMLVVPRVSEHPFGLIHQAVWTGEPLRRMSILELTKGQMILATKYRSVSKAVEGNTWVSPCFVTTNDSFDLRCAFDFSVWKEAGLQLFLGLNNNARTLQFWVHYKGQIYRPPFGNIFEASCQLCLGHNEKAYLKIFSPKQLDSVSLSHAVGLLNDSPWNADTFNAQRDLSILNKLIRFDSNKQELPMLPPLDPDSISKCSVAANQVLAQITNTVLKA
jgi:hypothetical protein